MVAAVNGRDFFFFVVVVVVVNGEIFFKFFFVLISRLSGRSYQIRQHKRAIEECSSLCQERGLPIGVVENQVEEHKEHACESVEEHATQMRREET